jgi:hypothetical protein
MLKEMEEDDFDITETSAKKLLSERKKKKKKRLKLHTYFFR